MKTWLIVGLVVLCAGCATGPYTPMGGKTLDKGDKLIYWEQADRISKDVMLEAWKHQPLAPPVVNGSNGLANVQMVIPPEVIAAILDMLAKTIPAVSAGYQKERMAEALLSRRMLFRGYTNTELKDITEMIKAMGWSLEYMTPQYKMVPAPSTGVK